jgi:mannose-6-phosphate isomerase-like protein (cupin superfamily)
VNSGEQRQRIVNRREESKVQKIRLAEKLASFKEQWSPKIVGELNGQHVKLVKFQGEFVWHHHDLEDEFFLVLRGSFRMVYRDESGDERSLEIAEGEFVIVPRGTEHRPYAAEEAHVLLFEPLATLNTGNVRSERTIEVPEGI